MNRAVSVASHPAPRPGWAEPVEGHVCAIIINTVAYIICEPCIGTKDTACVDVCPVDCIHPRKDEPEFSAADMLYIHPDECIDCGACEPECPWAAIFEEVAVPDVFKDDTPLNYKIMENMGDFKVAQHNKIEHPTAEQVQANKEKWGWTG